MRPWAVVMIAGLAAVIGAAAAIGVRILTDDPPAAAPPGTIVERVETRVVEVAAADGPVSAAEVVRRVLPTIVTVERGTFSDEQFVRTGGGSGVVIDDDGHLVTNHHVVTGADAVRVIFANGRIVPASVIGSDPLTDIAVLSIEHTDLTAITLGSTESLSVGDPAFAIGNPLSLEGGPSVTSGVVSAFDRRVSIEGGAELYGMLQTDAPITRGSSGGALVDGEGRLIGITTAVAVSDLGQEGLGFAIPVEIVRRVVQDIIETGTAQHAFLGITGSTYYVDHPDGTSEPAGIEVSEIIAGTAASDAGIVPGDILVTFNGRTVNGIEQLIVLLRLSRVGDVVTIGLSRDDDSFTVQVELQERPEGV